MDGPRATGNLEAPDLGAGTGFGHVMLEHWALDPAILYLNHGTVGATPRRVLAEQQRIRDEIERQPARYMLRELTEIAVGGPQRSRPRLRVAADQVAEFFSARGDDLVFVENATTGVNAVLRSLKWRTGDEILITNQVYGAVANVARFVTRDHGAAVRTVDLPDPPSPGAAVDAIEAALGPQTRLAIVEHITSEGALLLPLAEIAARCHARGVPVLADGAHAPGAIALDIPSQGVDWYVGNLHKWGFAPRASGILWAAKERQKDLHPAVISWGLDRSFTAEFDLVGTRDPSAHLAAPAGLALQKELGLEAMRAYNHGLAWRGARRLAERWRISWETPETMIGTMAALALPERAGSDAEEAARLRDALLFEDGIEVQLNAARGRLRIRISCQVYNDESDLDRLASAVLARI